VMTRLQTHIKCARLFLEDDDAVNAEAHLNRASALLPHDDGAGGATAAADPESLLHFRTCYARVLDSKRKFLEAAMKYYELSKMKVGMHGAFDVKEEECLQALQLAMACAVLAPAGPPRLKLLAMLYKDERTRALPFFDILESLYMERLLKKHSVDMFAQTLKPHQLAVTSDGSTVLQRAVTEHNILAASKIYINISFKELGTILGVPPAKAEESASRMIYEERLAGSIDQTDHVLDFSSIAPGLRAAADSSKLSAATTAAAAESEAAAGADAEPAAAADPMKQWDAQNAAVCRAVDTCCDAILAKHPELAEKVGGSLTGEDIMRLG